MIQHDLRARGIHNEAVLAAFQDIPRERFVPGTRARDAYGDHPLPIGFDQTISQPYVVALMCQELDAKAHHRVLDVGAGSGYQAAILSRLAGWVYAIERIDALTERARTALEQTGAENVTLRTGDGSLGWPAEAPFDRIICGAAAPELPQSWIDQLADGGRIIAPVGGQGVQGLVRVDKHGDRVERRALCDVRFVKLIGREAWPP